ncbi:MAG: N-6 DNA methylase [Synergistaceae bacterium]|jgi:type I restriction-modification system DNA methylase subunit|nr:N-6 DNA methylase [Synergistaceae bacterium]
MSEELIQRNLIAAPETMGAWNYYNIGATTLNTLKNEKIIPNKDYGAFGSKKPDALIVKKPLIIAVVEYKQPNELRTKKQIDEAILQEIGTARALGAKLYIVTDGRKTFWINPLTGNEVTTEDGSRGTLNFSKDDSECIKFITKAIASLSVTNDTVFSSAVVDPLPLARRVWQDLWSVSGATPENCLYTFVEIFIFKYLSDLGVLTGLYSFANLLNQYRTNAEIEVMEHYASTVRVKIKELFPWNPTDKTTIINGTIFVSRDDKAVSGYAIVFKKILERFDEFGTLENIDYDFKSKLFETFLKESISKKNWGQYFTPLKVVRAIAGMADISAGMKICDPACGVGKFLLEPVLHDIYKYFKVENGELKPQIILSGFDKGFDKDEQKTIILAKANMLIYLSSLIREHSGITRQFAELFNKTFLLQTNSILGTLAYPANDEYDLIFTNPPYVMGGSSNLKDEISRQTELKQYFSISAMGIEGLFMEWIIRALKPGGKAFVIVPDGIMNRANDKRLRDFILDECVIDAVISLPLNTFFTTNKKTYIAALTKKIPVSSGGVPAKERQTTPVFTYLCSEIGETRDVYRFDIEQNDLDTAKTNYNMFKGAREHFKTDDKRCKIVSIDEFYNGSHWSVERWWTREEKVALGIEDEAESVSIDAFVSMIDDTANTLIESRELLRELIKKKPEPTGQRIARLNDGQLFELSIGKRLLKKDFFNFERTIPAYSANVFVPFAHTEQSNVTDFSVPYVIWGIDGDFKFNVMKTGQPFATTDHCGSIKINNPRIDPYYLVYALEQTKHLYGFDRGLRASLTNMKRVEISIPIDAAGDFDLEAQRKTAEQFTFLSDMRNELRRKYSEINECNILITSESTIRYRTVSLCEDSLFDLITSGIGHNRTALSVMDTKDAADIPVYTAGKEPAAHIKQLKNKTPIQADEEHPLLSFATNGDGSAGRNFVFHKRPFYINVDRLAVRVKGNSIFVPYLHYCLLDMKRKYAFGHSYKANRYNLASVGIDIPMDGDGNFNLPAQREIAKTYAIIEQYKREILEKLNSLITQKVKF